MLKKTRLYIGISLMVQAITLVVLFLILAAKKKSIAQAFLAVAALEGAVGVLLLWQHSKDIERDSLADKSDEFDFFDDDDFEIDESILNADLHSDDDVKPQAAEEIPKDEDASEADFQ